MLQYWHPIHAYITHSSNPHDTFIKFHDSSNFSIVHHPCLPDNDMKKRASLYGFSKLDDKKSRHTRSAPVCNNEPQGGNGCEVLRRAARWENTSLWRIIYERATGFERASPGRGECVSPLIQFVSPELAYRISAE